MIAITQFKEGGKMTQENKHIQLHNFIKDMITRFSVSERFDDDIEFLTQTICMKVIELITTKTDTSDFKDNEPTIPMIMRTNRATSKKHVYCPHCGHKQSDAGFVLQEQSKICERCELQFTIEIKMGQVIVEYRTRPTKEFEEL